MEEKEERESVKPVIIRIIIAAVLTVGAYITVGAVPVEKWYLKLAMYAVPYIIVAYDVVWEAVKNLFTGHPFDEEFLMTAATVGAFAIGEYPEAVGVMIFSQIGEVFEDIAVGRSRKSVESLMDIRPDKATVIRNGEELTVPPEEVAVGETVIVRPGEKVPFDGVITEGGTALDTSALTGESVPADKTAGDKVVSGCVNLTGVIKIKVESSYGESTVAKILDLLENSSANKAKTERFTTRFSRVYTPAVVLCAVLLAVIPPLAFDGAWKEWIYQALVFLMVSCPCALVVSVPLTFFCAVGGASRKGILIKNAEVIERLVKADTVVFDKTGTLTRGRLAVTAVHPNEISEAELLDIAAAVESNSVHPVAESIVRAHGGHIDSSLISGVTEYAGMGVSAVINGIRYYAGNGRLMERFGADWHDCHIAGTAVHIACDSGDGGTRYLGHIIANDEVKDDSAEAISSLKALGIKQTVMLTGDSEKVAEAVSSKLGLDSFRAGMLPTGKVEAVSELIKAGHSPVFVGDGINDAPVMATADVGAAMGALSSDAAIEAADLVIMDDKPSKLATALEISRRTMRIVRENIIIALVVKLGILLLSVLGAVNMWAAVFADVGVMVIVVLNAVRAMKATRK